MEGIHEVARFAFNCPVNVRVPAEVAYHLDKAQQTLPFSADEARQAVAVLNQLLAVLPSEEKICENEFDNAPSPELGGTRIVRLVVYADSEVERRHDAEFARP